MGINFPDTPLVGDIWPSPAVAGQGQYTWDGEKWTAGATPASRASIYAAPFDAMAYSGMQINGSMEIDQAADPNRTVPQGGAKYTADGWFGSYIHAANTAVVTIQQAGVIGAMPSGFQNCIQLQATTAFSSPAAGDLIYMGAKIEGYRIARLGFGSSTAQPVTIGFWIFSNNTVGTMTLSLINNNASRTYLADFTINALATWEYKTITIPGDVTGTWEKTNLIGLRMSFCGGAGTNFQGANNAWQAGNFFRTPATTNFFAGSGNAVLITGLVVLPGIEAPSAARSPLIMRPYDQELVTCQRYWQKPTMLLSGSKTTGVTFQFIQPLVPNMRTTPAIAVLSNNNVGVDGTITRSASMNWVFVNFVAASTGGYVFNETLSLDARL